MPKVVDGAETVEQRLAEAAAAAARENWDGDPVAALAWLTMARAARRFYAGVRQSCTLVQVRGTDRRAGLPPEQQEQQEAAP